MKAFLSIMSTAGLSVASVAFSSAFPFSPPPR